MKLYRAYFVLLSIAEVLFSGLYFFLEDRPGGVLLTGLILYAGAMIAGLIAYKISAYNKRKKDLINSLPE